MLISENLEQSEIAHVKKHEPKTWAERKPNKMSSCCRNSSIIIQGPRSLHNLSDISFWRIVPKIFLSIFQQMKKNVCLRRTFREKVENE